MKKIIFLLVVCLTTSLAFSQDKAIMQNRFSDNWFLQLQGGGSLTFSEGHNKADFTKFISPHVAISLGKYFAPAVGSRIQIGGWQSKNYNFNSISSDETFKVSYLQANLDGLFNLSNLFAPSNPNKMFNIVGIMGIGYVHGYKDSDNGVPTTNSIVPRAGLQFDFRVSDRVSLNLEGVGNLMPDGFNGISTGKKYDATVNVLAGVTVNLGKRGFDVVDYIDPAKIRALDGELTADKSLIENLKASIVDKDRQIAGLKTSLDEKPKVVIETEKQITEETVMNAVVVFKLGKSDLLDNQEINIYNAAKFFQQNPNTDIIVTGYADHGTGNPALNQKLSERRAETVSKILIEKFGIAASRITTKGGGDKEQLFEIAAWNRVVVFTAIPKTIVR